MLIGLRDAIGLGHTSVNNPRIIDQDVNSGSSLVVAESVSDRSVVAYVRLDDRDIGGMSLTGALLLTLRPATSYLSRPLCPFTSFAIKSDEKHI